MIPDGKGKEGYVADLALPFLSRSKLVCSSVSEVFTTFLAYYFPCCLRINSLLLLLMFSFGSLFYSGSHLAWIIVWKMTYCLAGSPNIFFNKNVFYISSDAAAQTTVFHVFSFSRKEATNVSIHLRVYCSEKWCQAERLQRSWKTGLEFNMNQQIRTIWGKWDTSH